MEFTDIPPRPRWNHKCVKEATAEQFVDDIRHWAENFGVVDGDHDNREFLALLSIALIESPDSYQAGRYLEDFFGWPVQADLVRVLDACYARMKHVTRDLVHAWVMENNVRFPAKKGDMIRARIGDVTINGRVIEVIRREAKGFFIPNGKDKPMPVYAEEVQQVLPGKKVRPEKPEPPEIA